MPSGFSLAIVLTAADRAAVAGFGRVRRQIKGMGGDVQKAQRQFDGMMRSFRAGAAMAAAGFALAKSLKPAVQAAGDLQAAMIRLKTESITPGIDTSQLRKDMDDYRALALEIQRETSFDITGVFNIMTELKKGGLDKEVIKKSAARATAQFATVYADLVSPAEAGTMLTKLAAGFNVKDFAQLADDLARFAGTAATNVVALADATMQASQAAAQFGVSPRKAMAAVTAMQGRGVKEASAGESLKAFFVKLGAAMGEPAKAAKLAQFGIKPFDDKGKFKEFGEVIKMFRSALEPMSQKERIKALVDVFGERMGPRLLSLFTGGAGGYEDILAKREKSAGLQRRMNERLRGFQAAWDAFGGNVQSTLAVAFEPLIEGLTEGTNLLDTFVNKAQAAILASEPLRKGISYGVPVAAGALGVGSIVAILAGATKGAGLLKTLRASRLGRFAGKGVGVATELAQAKGLQTAGVEFAKVWVVNWPDQLKGGMLSAGGKAGAAGAATGAVGFWGGKAGKFVLTRAAPLAGVIGLGIEASSEASIRETRERGWDTIWEAQKRANERFPGIEGHRFTGKIGAPGESDFQKSLNTLTDRVDMLNATLQGWERAQMEVVIRVDEHGNLITDHNIREADKRGQFKHP